MQKLLNRCALAWIVLAALGLGSGMAAIAVCCALVAFFHFRIALYLRRMGME